MPDQEVNVPFAAPTVGITEVDAVRRVLESGWLTQGPETSAFEREAAAFLKQDRAVAVSSCSAGLHLALIALGIGPGDEVITSPFTFVSTVHAIEHVGATPIFADIDPKTLNIDTKHVRTLLSKRTAAILPVYYGGHPWDCGELLPVLRDNKISVVADAAHAFGTRIEGLLLEDLADLTVYSFYATKTITTGEGGLITGRSDLVDEVILLRDNGLTTRTYDRRVGHQYDVVRLGYKYILPDILAAIGREQVRRAPEFLRRRHEIRQLYDSFLASEANCNVFEWNTNESCWLFPLRIHGGKRDDILSHLLDEGIHTSVLFPSVPTLTYYAKRYPDAAATIPNSLRASEEILCLPCYPDLEDTQVQLIVTKLQQALQVSHK